MPRAAVFDKTYWDYLAMVAQLDLPAVTHKLGLELVDGEVVMPFYGVRHRLSPQGGIVDDWGRRPHHFVSVVLCRHLIMCPAVEPVASDWVTFKDFKDAAPFIGGFAANAERPIRRAFEGRLDALQKAGAQMGGLPTDIGVACDLVMRFTALPKLPVLMLFNDRDDEFGAQCTLLFERRAETYLDMECLAMVGGALADGLKRKDA